MITPEQERWLANQSDTDRVKIYPPDLKAGEKFEQIKKIIQSALGENINVVHKGATSLGISGQGELDIYIPVLPEKFNFIVSSVENIFGKPRSLYPLERARFVTYVENTKAEVFVINEEGKGWINSSKFEEYVRQNPKTLNAYQKLKEEGEGLSTQKYYRRKIEFINDILANSQI